MLNLKVLGQWALTGNSGTSPFSNFIGTLDQNPLMIRVNNQKAGWLDYDPLKGNTSFGTRALLNITTGYKNTALGFSALHSNTSGNSNTAMGYYSLFGNSTGDDNTAIGVSALNSNYSGSRNVSIGNYSQFSNLYGNNNTAIGMNALYSNTVSDNTAVGHYSLQNNTSGTFNTATGHYSLYNNTTGNNNSAIGYESLYNSNGSDNTANGFRALYNNTSGNYNTAIGYEAAHLNTTGEMNTAIGYHSLPSNISGSYNTAIGHRALFYSNGSYNTGIGTFTRMNVQNASYSNTTLIGAGAIGTASDQVRIGTTTTSSIGGYSSWTTLSDKNYKTNIQQNVKGLEFIRRLKPITYTLDVDGINTFLNKNLPQETDPSSKTQIYNDSISINNRKSEIQTGFIAQDVEKVCSELGFNFSGIDAPKNSLDLYGLRYEDFVTPIIVSIKELKAVQDSLRSRYDSIIYLTQSLYDSIILLEKKLTRRVAKKPFISNNFPNPTYNNTTIEYYIPPDIKKAEIIISDARGALLEKHQLKIGEHQKILIDFKNRVSGIYYYSLLVDKKIITTKKIIFKRN